MKYVSVNEMWQNNYDIWVTPFTRTHQEMLNLHGKEITFTHNDMPLTGVISIWYRKNKSYIYLCNDIKGQNVNKLKVQSTFGYRRALMISYSEGKNRYECKKSLTKDILVIDKDWTLLDKSNIFPKLKDEGLYQLQQKYQGEWHDINSQGSNIINYIEQDGILKIFRYKKKEKKEMDNKERALQELEGIKARMVELERIIKEPEGYPCITPVDWSGNILFNEQRQILRINIRGLYIIESVHYNDTLVDESSKFQWIPIKREDLKVGDTAFRTDKVLDFSNPRAICKILNNKDYIFIVDNYPVLGNQYYTNWYKLVPKEDK